MTLSELRPPLRRGLNSQLDPAIWPLSTRVDELGRLCIGAVAATDIAAEFGTPTYVVDEEDFRARIRCYRAALPGVDVVYAGKALLSAAVAGWAAAEGAGVGVCSGGELATALAGGVSPSQIILHGDAKTAGDLHEAAAAGVGRIVIDSPSEIALLASRARRQRVLVRVIPDLQTGSVEPTFGFALAGGEAAGAVKRVLDQPCLDLVGLHCQLGSQLSDAKLYGAAIRQMMAVLAEVRDRHQVVLCELNLGGGQAVPGVTGGSGTRPARTRYGHRGRPGIRLYAAQLPAPTDRDRTWPSDRRSCRDNPVPRDRRQAPARRASSSSRWTVAGPITHERRPADRHTLWHLLTGIGQPVWLPSRSWGETGRPGARSHATSSCPPISTQAICWR